MRTARELLIASREFASENRKLSWWHLWSTLGVLIAFLAVAVSDLHLVVRVAASVGAGLVSTRLFIIYHDYQHHAILRGSKLADMLMAFFGLLILNPPSVWNRTHDHHHKNNAKSFAAGIGSFPIMTKHAYDKATSSERFAYAVARHPLTIACGYLTVFLWRMCLRPFLLHPRQHLDGGLAVLLNVLLSVALAQLGWDVLVFGMIGPLWVAAALGAYLFYAQHNYPAVVLRPREEWSHVDAALHSSSFMAMGPIMNWFTGNIGYHHVHHLNSRIPFYRLPEAMAALEELQAPGTTSLHPRDIRACLRLKLWSVEDGKLVGFNGV